MRDHLLWNRRSEEMERALTEVLKMVSGECGDVMAASSQRGELPYIRIAGLELPQVPTTGLVKLLRSAITSTMCNRYENELSTRTWAELLPVQARVSDEAALWEPLSAQNISTIGLCLVENDGRWTLRTAVWGFIHPHYKGATFNTRTDSAPPELLPPIYRQESGTSAKGLAKIWQGGDLRRCWMPATAWLECPRPKTKLAPALWLRMHLQGEPFVLAGVCGERDGAFRMSMTMTETPESLPAIRAGHTRMPLAFGLEAIGQADPQLRVHERIEVSTV
jgi:putative SOS response-associated peptidase YedK